MTRAFGDGRMERFFTYDVVELTASQLAQQETPAAAASSRRISLIGSSMKQN
ncbi:MAG: hypothetical protein R3C56_26180 [Pirellulaceae bacterium]